jgi:putative transposase
MDENSIRTPAETALFAGEAWFDPIEAGLRGRIRGLIEEMIEQELGAALGRGRYERGGAAGHRHGHRKRPLTGSLGPVEIAERGCALRMAQSRNGAALCCHGMRGGPGRSRR